MRKPIILLMVIWISVVTAAYFWTLTDEAKGRRELALQTARAFFMQIVLTREWNAKHGGVYVPVTSDVQPNPYLDDPLRDVVTEDGLRLTKVNPSYMTRQIAAVAAEENGVLFHLTSLRPVRPENRALPWEIPWLQSFENGQTEQGRFLEEGGEWVYRYMAPLYVEGSCMKCHARHGYELGDVRGGISITLPFSPKGGSKALLVSYVIAALLGLVALIVTGSLLERSHSQVVRANEKLQKALDEVKTLSGFLPICASCKKIRDDKGYWNQIESYIRQHSDAEFSHGICPECARKLYPEFAIFEDEKDEHGG